MSKALKILMLFDLSVHVTPEEYDQYLTTEDWKTEANILQVLKKLGHTVKPFGLRDDIRLLINEINENRPDLVFNLSEAFNNERHFEPHIVSMLELLGVKYTGATPEALRICKDKGLTKKILSYHRLHIPKFLVARRLQPEPNLKKFAFPALIKPLSLEASEGISQVSLVNNEKDTKERVKFIHDRLNSDAIIEEFIEGREIYVGILGNERLSHFPARELFFKQVPEGEPKFATYRAKWNEAYRKKWGIDSGPADPIAPAVEEKMIQICKKIYRALKLKGYGRIDLRLRPNGEVVFIEANPNPSLAKEEDFAQAALKAGMSYEKLVAKIISLSDGTR